MDFIIKKAALSDIGSGRRINQDAVFYKVTRNPRFHRICFAVICDGLGGLSEGEVASGSFIRRMEEWYAGDFPRLIRRACTDHLDAGQCLHRTRLMWQSIIMEMNESIASYGRARGIRLGTTAVAFLLIGSSYIVMHVGDSRLYIASGGVLSRITHDHSLVQQQLDAGLLTPRQALLSDKKSVLLQCIGASHVVRPDFTTGTLWQDASILLCTDGFWRRLHEEEIYEHIRCSRLHNEQDMQHALAQLIRDARRRGENDNISAILLKLLAEEQPVREFRPVMHQAVLC